MTEPVFPLGISPTETSSARENNLQKIESPGSDIGKRFEQMLWAEMLMHAGLEDALTKNGGEAASSFSRFVVEAIAADIAEKHPLGLDMDVPSSNAGKKP